MLKNSFIYDEVKNHTLSDNLRGRSIRTKVIPTVCNLGNMLDKLLKGHGDASQIKQWEKRSYNAYKIKEISNKILCSQKIEWRDIIRNHILNARPSDFGASCIDIYLVGHVSEKYGSGRENFIKYIKDNNISDKDNSAQAIWQVGKGDGVYLGILNNDGSIKDWDFINKWLEGKC